MLDTVQTYTQCFAGFSTLKKSSFSFIDLKNTSIIVALALASKASECSEFGTADKMNTFSLTKEEKDNLCIALNLTPNSLKKNLLELARYKVIQKISSDTYRMNPFIFATGNESTIARCRNYCAQNTPFVPLSKNQANKFSYIFNSIANLTRFACFIGTGGAKVINKTELAIFLMLSAEVNFCSFPKSPDSCNIVYINERIYKKLSQLLGLDERTIKRAVASLCNMHLLHKFAGVDCKYMVNPFLSGKGSISNIWTLQFELVTNPKYKSYFDGFAAGDVLERKSA